MNGPLLFRQNSGNAKTFSLCVPCNFFILSPFGERHAITNLCKFFFIGKIRTLCINLSAGDTTVERASLFIIFKSQKWLLVIKRFFGTTRVSLINEFPMSFISINCVLDFFNIITVWVISKIFKRLLTLHRTLIIKFTPPFVARNKHLFSPVRLNSLIKRIHVGMINPKLINEVPIEISPFISISRRG